MNAIANDDVRVFANRLRDATRRAHRGLDHHPLLAPLTRAPLTKSDYAKALAALHGPQRAIENVLSGFAPEMQFPSRLADLEADLDAMGTAPLPLLAELPRFDSVDQLIGAMYVIEGSNLGGTVIARLLDESLPAAMPRLFFANSGGHARWGKFWEFATGYCLEENFSVTAEAACLTFGLYKDHLDRCQHV